MEEAAVPRIWTREIFSIDVATVVLSRRAVKLLTEASCAPLGAHRAGFPSLEGQLRPLPHSSACVSDAASGHGWVDWSLLCRSRGKALDANTPSVAKTEEVSGDPQAQGASLLPVSLCAAVSENFRNCGEGTTSAARGCGIHPDGESHSSTESMAVSGSARVGESSNTAVCPTPDCVSSIHLDNVSSPCTDFPKRYEARDKWRRSSASCRGSSARDQATSAELAASSNAVSSRRQGSFQTSSMHADGNSADRKESQMRRRRREDNNAAGVLQRQNTVSSDQVARCTRAASEENTCICCGKEDEDDGSGKHLFRQYSTDQLYKFLGAAFTATRSSFYVCVPIDATEGAVSHGCVHATPLTGSPFCRPPDQDIVRAESNAGSTFPAEFSAADDVAFADRVTGYQDSATSGDVFRPDFTAASFHAEHRNIDVTYKGPPGRKTPTMTAAAAAATNADDAEWNTSNATPVSGASVGCSVANTSSSVRQPVSFAVHRATAQVNPVSPRAAVTAASDIFGHGKRRPLSERTESPAGSLYGNGLCCTYSQHDPRQPVLTPTCKVFRLIQHLYAFFARCAIDFTPFAADVYVVPVWVGATAVGDAVAGSPCRAGAASGPSPASAGRSSEAAIPSNISTSAHTAAATGNAGAGEREVGSAPTCTSSATAPAAHLAVTLLAASGNTTNTTGDSDKDTCGWRDRLLQALQNHCRSCRGTRVTGRQLVNVVDSSFELADRSFALSSAGAGDFAAHSHALPVNMLHAFRVRPFSEIFSALKIPPVPTTAPAKEDIQRRGPSQIAKKSTSDFEAGNRAEKGDAKESASVGAEAARAAEAPDDAGAALYEEATATRDCPVETVGTNPTTTEPAVADRTDTDVAQATDVVAVCDATAETYMGSGRCQVIAGKTVESGMAATGAEKVAFTNQGRPHFANALRQFSHVIVAGTFDRLHAGHKMLLTVAALLSGDKLGIGITAGALIEKKVAGDAAEAAAAVQSFAARAHAAAAFVALVATAAWAPASAASGTSRVGDALSEATPVSVVSTLGRELAVSKTGHTTSAAGYEGDHLPHPTSTCGQATASEKFTVVADCGEIGRDAQATAEVKQGGPRPREAAATALEMTSRRRVASTSARTVLGDEDGAEATSACRRATLRPVRFINYCQTVLHDEVFKGKFRQKTSPARCACANRFDTDVDATRLCCGVDKPRGEIDIMTLAEVATKDTREQEGCYDDGGPREDKREGLCAGDASEQNSRRQIWRQHGHGEQMRTPAAESSKDVDAPGDEQEIPRRESEPVREPSSTRNRKLAEETGLTGGNYGEVSKAEEQVRKPEIEQEEQENWWRELVCGALAEIETSETQLSVPLDLVDRRSSSLSVTLAGEDTYNAQPMESAVRSQKTCTPTQSGEGHFPVGGNQCLLPWVSCVLPPNFSFSAGSRAMYRKPRAGAGAADGDCVRGADDKGSDSPGRAVSLSSCPGAASAPPPFATTFSSMSASHSAAALTPSSAVSPLATCASFLHKHETSKVVPFCTPASFPASRQGTHIASPSDPSVGDDRGTHLAVLTCTPAPSEGATPHHHVYSRPPRPSSGGRSLGVYIISLEDPLGPAGWLDFDGLVVSSESLVGGFYVNDERIKRSHSPVSLIVVPALSAAELFTYAKPAVILQEPDTLGKSVYSVPIRGGSLVRLEGAPLCPLPIDSDSPKGVSGGGACRDMTSRVGGSQTTARSYSSSEPAYGQHQDQDKSAESCASFSREVSNSKTTEKIGVSKLEADVEQGVGVPGREERLPDGPDKHFTGTFCQGSMISRNQGDRRGTAAATSRATSACVGGSTQENTNSFRPGSEIDKLSSSHLRQLQATGLQSRVDVVCLQRQFAEAASALFHAPAPVRKAYWSMLCSLYVAPWRRLFTVERLARLLSRLVIVKERIPELKCLGTTCDAIVKLSLCFAYALHPPPGRYQCNPPKSCAVPAVRSASPFGRQRLHEFPTECPGSSTSHTDRSSQPHSLYPCFECARVKVGVTGAKKLSGGGGARVLAKQHSVGDPVADANEDLMRSFLWDATVCSQLRHNCLHASSAEQLSVFDTASKRNFCACSPAAARLHETSHINTDYSKRDEDDKHSSEVLPRIREDQLLHILVSCMRTTRECCGFLLPHRSSLVNRCSEMSAYACPYSPDEEKNKVALVEEVTLQPGRSDCPQKACPQKHTDEVVHSEAEPFERTSATCLQQLEIECCRGVRMLELLELALPGIIYDFCARRMREEYYHLCDHHYACHRRKQLQSLQMRLSGCAHGLTEDELGLVQQNLAREQSALNVEDKLQQAEPPSLACACD